MASVIFTGGCNLRCPFCYNADLVLPERLARLPDIPEEEVLEKLAERRGFIDGVVITGGEPLIHGDRLEGLIAKVKELELAVKLDTNGMFPEKLRGLLPLLDFVAIDVKAVPSCYPEFGGDWSRVKESIELVKESEVDYELRITAVPVYINEASLQEIAREIEGAKCVALQKFVNKGTIDPSFEKVHPYTRAELEALASILKPYVEKVVVR